MTAGHRSTARRLGLLAGVAALAVALGDVGTAPTRITLDARGDGWTLGAVRLDGGLFGGFVGAALAQSSDVTLEDITIDAGFADITIPSLTIAGTSLSEQEIRAILQGKGGGDLAAALEGLDAREISAPEITLTQTEDDVTVEIVHRDVSMTDVTGGVIGSFTVPTTDVTVTVDGESEMTGVVSDAAVDSVDLVQNVRFVTGSAAEGADNPFRQLYGGYTVGGIELTAKDGESIVVGAITGDPTEVRLLRTGLAETMRFLASIDENAEPTDEETRRIFAIMADLYGALRTGAVTVDGIDIYEAEADTPIASVAAVEIGPNFESSLISGISIEDDEFTGSIEAIETSGFDMQAFVAAMEQVVEADLAGEEVDPAVAFAMIRPLGSMTISGFEGEAVVEGETVPISLGAFTMSGNEEIEGATGGVLMAIENLMVEVPSDGTDEFSMMVRQLGYETLDLSGAVVLGWNGDDSTVIVEEISVAGTDMGAVVMTALLGDVGPEIFSTDETAQQMALLQSTFRQVTLTVTDEGIAEKALTFAAQMQGTTPDALRAQAAGAAGGMLPMILGGTPESFALGEAVASFVNQPGELDIVVSAKDPAGIPMMQLAGAASDPQSVLPLVTIEAVAR